MVRRPDAAFGLQTEDLTPERARRADYQSYHGVIVTTVTPVSFGEDVGFKRGDLIEEINHVAINSMADYRKLLGALKPGQETVFKVVRHSESDRLLTIFLAGIVPAANDGWRGWPAEARGTPAGAREGREPDRMVRRGREDGPAKRGVSLNNAHLLSDSEGLAMGDTRRMPRCECHQQR